MRKNERTEITAELLRELDACSESVMDFDAVFPQGAKVTSASLSRWLGVSNED